VSGAEKHGGGRSLTAERGADKHSMVLEFAADVFAALDALVGEGDERLQILCGALVSNLASNPKTHEALDLKGRWPAAHARSQRG
jgi:hypothetical protein